MSPAATWTLLSFVLGLPTLLCWGLCKVAGRESREEERRELHTHTCSICGRTQRWLHEFDQFSPCRACQTFDLRRPIEIDLDDFADADAIKVYLDGVSVPVPDEVQPAA